MPTTTNYIWDEQNYLAETDGNNVVQTVYSNEPQRYGYLISSRISGTTSYHQFDAIGSTRQLTNSAAINTDTVIYDAWGNVVVRSGTTHIALLWIGEVEYYFDTESSLLYVRSRIYAPAIARWTAVDPILLPSGDTSLSYYQYVRNAVNSVVDASGVEPNSLDIALSPHMKPVSRLCGNAIVIWRISPIPMPKDGERQANEQFVAIVQFICHDGLATDCTLYWSTPCCLSTAKAIRTKCCYYEFLGVAAPKQNGFVDDTWGTPLRGRPGCTSKGYRVIFATVRGFNDGMAIRDEAKQNPGKWTPAGVVPCGGDTVKMAETRAANDPPDWWNDPKRITDQGSDIFKVEWDCCPGDTQVAIFGSNSTPSTHITNS